MTSAVEFDVILCDAVGTLIAPEPTAAVAYHAAAVRHGFAFSLADVDARFRAAFARSEANAADPIGGRTDEDAERRRWRQIVNDVFPGAGQGDALFQELWQHFAEPRHWRLFDDAVAILPELASQGLPIAVASNFDSRLRVLCRGLEPLSNIQSIFVSSELGARKPQAAFFTAVEHQLGIAGERLLLVGDSPTNDYHAARTAGWQALLVDREDRHADVPREHKLGSLAELVERVVGGPRPVGR